MKTRLFFSLLHKPIMKSLRPFATRLLFIIALSPVLCALSQIPQGFNYQAVARDPLTGFSITGSPMKVQLTIQTDSVPSGTILWQETHNVTTNSFGLINVIIGKGTRVSGAASFSQIDWTSWPDYFIKTEIEYPLGSPPYKLMGISRLWSVPYAMIANDFDGPVKKLAVKGETASLDEALFEVKNKDGQTIFAVYNEGVRVYVSDGAKGLKGGFAVGGFGTDKAESTKYLFVDKDSVRVYLDTNPLTKKLKGGFSVGGYDLTKGIVQDYLDVNSDSVRIYIDSDPSTKKLKGGFAVGGYDMTKGSPLKNFMRVTTDSTRVYVSDVTKAGSLGGFAVKPVTAPSAKTDFFNVTNAATAEVIKNEPRVMWYSKKSALIGGEVHVGSADSVGLNSTALGYRSIAKGNQSQAFGYRSLAYGTYSTAIGYKAESNTNGMAVGYLAKASGSDAFALGSGALAIANKSFAFGSVGIDSLGNVTGNTKATGDYAYAFGLGSVASGQGAFAIGANDTASGEFSYAAGYKTKATKWYSTSMGGYSEATGYYSAAIGFKVKAIGTASTSMGYYSTANGHYSSALGYMAKATGAYSVSIGSYSNAQGAYSVALGYNNNIATTGSYAFATGGDNTASAVYAFVTGNYSQATGSYSLAGGYGSTASKIASIAAGYQATASGNYSVAHGYGTIASGSGSAALNYSTTAGGDYSVALNQQSTATGKNAISAGFLTTAQAYASFVIGKYNVITGTTTSWVNAEPLFVAGNGTSSSVRTNALTLLKDGNMTIAGSLTQNSDLRLKENISSFTGGIEKIEKIYPVYFDFKDQATHPSGRQIGFIAQDVRDVLPELVQQDANGYLSVDYSKMTVVLLQVVKEQQIRINNQESENCDLKGRIEKLETEMLQMRNILSSR